MRDYRTASPATQQAPPPMQPFEHRPTFVGQLDTMRLAIYGAFGAALGVLLHFVADVDRAPAIVAGAVAVLALLALPVRAQCDATCSQVPEPPIGMACASLHPWSCDSYQLYLPEVVR